MEFGFVFVFVFVLFFLQTLAHSLFHLGMLSLHRTRPIYTELCTALLFLKASPLDHVDGLFTFPNQTKTLQQKPSSTWLQPLLKSPFLGLVCCFLGLLLSLVSFSTFSSCFHSSSSLDWIFGISCFLSRPH
ncbi:uncharacterized protein SOCG_05085 [Schizosaccharomyces octosporus yFS286]|uniref:Uncharacterized protein n=1 Tax=Schizosaccharomyces octosporus (strain yFS286) TaxID=483514 RepID=S9PY40_SCHOY|nr:uncharacterized protein SOCG_05085 [Schizosaccharomyces octosporus yFS286]EPX73996.1 hypothetical protein SOCG_05085 [Schizosaccharomyces octosporus yFS286]